MLVRAVLMLCVVLSAAAVAKAQAPTPPAAAPAQLLPPLRPAEEQAQQPPPGQEQPPGRTFCDESIAYHLTDPASVQEQYRRFVGIWSDAAWDAKTCAALIVEDVKPDGSASIIYIYGPEGSGSAVPGVVLHGTGVIRGDQLRFQNSDGSQYAFRPGLVDMIGHWIDPKGESFQATFKSTP